MTTSSLHQAVEPALNHQKTSISPYYYDTNDDFNKNITLIPRAFDTWPTSSPLPCFPAESDWDRQSVQHTPTQQGFLYVKPYKCASSTVAGVQIRIAQHVAQRQLSSTTSRMCQARFSHGPRPFPAHSLYSSRNSAASFLWTVLRDPIARAVSGFFHFRVSKRHNRVTQFPQSLLRPDP